MKKCTKCGVEKPLSEFHLDPKRRDGHRSDCKICHKNAGLKRARKRKYGLSHDQFLQLLKNQNNKCLICLKKLQTGIRTHVDHCHKTGTIRGVLCNNCNRGIGYLQDSPTVLKSALNYLEKYNSKSHEK